MYLKVKQENIYTVFSMANDKEGLKPPKSLTF